MPIALIKIIEGRSPEKKRRLIESVSRAMAESLEIPIDGVRVLVEEYSPDLWGRAGRPVADIRKDETSDNAADPVALATAKLLSN